MDKAEYTLTDRQTLISIVVPVYNCEAFLNRCITSLINQTHKNLEIILVDDGSTDNSGKICDDFAITDNRITVFHQKNGGVSKARNAGLGSATGAFVAFIDSDDWIHSRYFETLLFYQKKCNADIVSCRNLRVKEFVSDEPIDVSDIDYRNFTQKEILSDTLAKTCVWARIYKMSILKNLKFLENVNLGEDTCFNLTAILSSNSFVMVEQPMYYYFIARDDSLVHTANYDHYFSVGLYYLKQAELPGNKASSKNIWLIEAIKVMLACRYLSSFSSKREIIKNCNKQIKKSLLHLKKIDIKSYIKFFVLYISPSLYRTYRILTDKTLINFEKQQKKKLKT